MTDASNEQGRIDQDTVGYGKPPKHSQFKKGQSGNPKGRPRGKRNMASLVGDVLAQKVGLTCYGCREINFTILRVVGKVCDGIAWVRSYLLFFL